MRAAVVVKSRRTVTARCAVCHDAIGIAPSVCPRCRTVLHRECRAQLSRCPTLGCRARHLAALPVAASRVERGVPLAAASMLSVVTAVLAFLGLFAGKVAPVWLAIGALVHFVLVPASWAERARSRDTLRQRVEGYVRTCATVLAFLVLMVPLAAIAIATLALAFPMSPELGFLLSVGVLVLAPPCAAWLAEDPFFRRRPR